MMEVVEEFATSPPGRLCTWSPGFHGSVEAESVGLGPDGSVLRYRGATRSLSGICSGAIRMQFLGLHRQVPSIRCWMILGHPIDPRGDLAAAASGPGGESVLEALGHRPHPGERETRGPWQIR